MSLSASLSVPIVHSCHMLQVDMKVEQGQGECSQCIALACVVVVHVKHEKHEYGLRCGSQILQYQSS